MEVVVLLLRLIIPFVVLYTIGYLVPGFSALTILWLIMLSVLIVIGDLLIIAALGARIHQWGRFVIHFLTATFIIFTVTLAIQGGQVPLGGSLLAAVLIAGLNLLLVRPFTRVRAKQ